jgi:hypothetical protein
MINISVMVTTEGDYRGRKAGGATRGNAATKGGAASMYTGAGAVTSGAVTSGADTTGAGTTRGAGQIQELLDAAFPGALSKPSMVRCRLAAWQTNEQT